MPGRTHLVILLPNLPAEKKSVTISEGRPRRVELEMGEVKQ
jgi:hypothetical protein